MKSIIDKVDEVLKEVSRLKGSAQTDREFEDYDSALQTLDDATTLLDPLLSEIKKVKDTEQVEHYETLRFKLARELSDCYGMKGGIYRRLGALDLAENMYEKGAQYEQGFNIPDTYNRTNVIVLKLLRDPNKLEALGEMIRASRNLVQDQVNGKNKNKWWAWADFGLLNLLIANLEDSEHPGFFRNEAHSAYEKFKETGAEIQHFESTIMFSLS